MTLYEIELAVANMYGIRTHIIVPNVSWGFEIHECDLLVVRPTGYMVEVEIKRSRADIKKDGEKRHGHVDRHGRIKELYFAIPESLEKHKDLIPERAGIIICRRTFEGWLRARIDRKAKINKYARKLTDAEKYQLTRLGMMRIWGLKETIINKQINIQL